MSRIVFFCFLLLTAAKPILAQEAVVYNINNYNGLSSNHVYVTHVDRHGYLWIGTADGVYRYNGFFFRRYDYNDGLHNIDIWNMYEDKHGRLWLLTIANGIGYIKNNLFKSVYINPDRLSDKIYPDYFHEFDSLIIFANKYQKSESIWSYAIIKNDTLDLKIKLNDPLKYARYILGSTFVIANDSIMNIYPVSALIEEDSNSYGIPVLSTAPTVNHLTELMSYTINGGFAGKYRYYSNPKSSYVLLFSPKENTLSKFDLSNSKNKSEQIAHVFARNNSIIAITNYGAVEIDNNLEVKNIYTFDSLYKNPNLNNFNNTYFLNNVFWGNCLSTSDKGLYINYEVKNVFKPVDIDLSEYSYISNIDDSTAYWWNEEKNILAVIKRGVATKSFFLKDMFKIRKIIPYNNEKSLLFSNRNVKWLYKDGRLEDFLSNVNEIIHNKKKHAINKHFAFTYTSILDGIIKSSEIFYLIGSGFLGLVQIQTDYENKIIYSDDIDIDKYKGILHCNYSDKIICYTGNKILIYDSKTHSKNIITSVQLKLLGINDIQKIVTDKYGNIIIKDYDKLYIYNPLRKKITRVLRNYNLKNAFISINNGIVGLAGNFGVIRCSTDINGKLIKLNMYANTKSLLYHYLYDVQFSSDNVLLKTDRGNYIVNTAETETNKKEGNTYTIILDNDSTLFSPRSYDTITVRQTTNAIGIDIIKPTGTGNLNIEYSINGAEYINSGYQVIIPKLEPGSYNTLTVIASDDSWQSEPVTYNIYIEPKWWQTSTAKQILFVLVILSIIGLVYITIAVTKRLVNSSNERRNQRRELELKSIYSQINPHFIFNSLSTAQYFVKKNKNKEAFEHINQFSDLLRSYIKSSRNKYITIEEEIENLENYLQLQLTRFEEKFDYSIHVDETVDSKTIKIPSLLLQPIVENALNHGIFHSETKGLLNISFAINRDNKNELICVVDDNGIGRKKSRELRSEQIRKADSYGTILIKELVDTFNKYEKIKIEIEYIDKMEPDNGTTVIIRINNFTHAR